MYLESLKSYERYASSDTLFVRAVDAVHASDGGSIESMKSRVLKVSKPASTAVLEISATLGDAKKAQALAQYVAEQTVELNKSLAMQSSAELVNEFRNQLNAAKARYAAAQKSRDDFAAAQPVGSLEDEVREATDLKFRLEQDLEAARTDLADYTAQRETPSKNTGSSDNEEWLRRQIVSARAKVGALESQTRELGATLVRKGPQLEARKASRDALEAEERSAAGALDAANGRMNEMLATSLTHGERLQIIDPGIVPQRPSSPNTTLNVIAALLVSLLGSTIWLGFRFGYTRLLSVRSEHVYSHSIR